MPRLLLLAASLSTAVDQRTNQLSLFHVVEQFNPKKFPATLPYFEVVCLWQRESGDDANKFQERLRMLSPGGVEEVTNYMVEFPLDRMRHRAIVGFAGVKVEEPGFYEIEVCLRKVGAENWGDPKGSFFIQVNRAPEHPPKEWNRHAPK